MPTGVIPDPFGNYNFLVEIDGIARAAFQEASGFDSSIDVIEHREGGENTTMSKLPGLTKYSNITLKWGTTDDRELYDWHRALSRETPWRRAQERLHRLARPQRQEMVRWNFVRAWPSKWDGPDFNAEGNDAAIETLELTHEGIERV